MIVLFYSLTKQTPIEHEIAQFNASQNRKVIYLFKGNFMHINMRKIHISYVE